MFLSSEFLFSRVQDLSVGDHDCRIATAHVQLSTEMRQKRKEERCLSCCRLFTGVGGAGCCSCSVKSVCPWVQIRIAYIFDTLHVFSSLCLPACCKWCVCCLTSSTSVSSILLFSTVLKCLYTEESFTILLPRSAAVHSILVDYEPTWIIMFDAPSSTGFRTSLIDFLVSVILLLLFKLILQRSLSCSYNFLFVQHSESNDTQAVKHVCNTHIGLFSYQKGTF